MTLLALAGLLVVAVTDGETVVRAHGTDDVDVARVATPGLADDGRALLLVPGVGLSRDGGPLAPVRPLLRGLTGPRLVVDALGLPVTDPAAGVVDVGLLPWGLGDAVVDVGAGAGAGPGGGLAGALSVRRPGPGLVAAVGAGDLSTLRGRARLVHAVDAGTVGGFLDLGSTRGDFAFDQDDALGTGGPARRRTNNDQQRANAALFADVAVVPGVVRVDVAAVGGLRRGGVPGFATAPLTLRAEDGLATVGGAVDVRPGGDVRARVGVDGTASDRRVTGDDRDSRVVGSRLGGRIDVDAAAVLGGVAGAAVPVDARLQVRADRATVAGGAGRSGAVVDVAARDEAHGRLSLRARWAPGAVSVTAEGDAGLGVVVDDDRTGAGAAGSDAAAAVTWLPRGRLRVAVGGRDDGVLGFVGVAHAARAPTLDERFAPRGFLLGNPGLRPERVDEIEAGVVVGPPAARARAVAHASALHDVIVVVNRNAFELVPENTGEARRAGIDVGATWRPLPLLSVDVAGALLATSLDATGAPVPGAPPVVLACAPRVGDDQAFVGAVIAARGPVAATLFGTARSPGNVLVDAQARVPLGPGLAATLLVQNAFDVRDARDQNLLPLPGRWMFVSLEVRA